MALFLKLLWDYRKAIAVGMVAIAALIFWQRLGAWHEAYKSLPIAQAELAAERRCDLNTECHKRAADLAEQARQEAALKAQEALQAAEQAEAKARADAAAWRRKYQAALNTDPECAAWARQAIVCPL